jgi:hypothetical protein
MALGVTRIHHIQGTRLRHHRGNQYAIGSNQTAEMSQLLLQARFRFQHEVVLANRILNLDRIDHVSLVISRPVEEQWFDRRIGTPHQHP